jgi:SNF2 family DNA or RNA helicase
MINFEYVAHDKILYKEGSRIIKDEELDHLTYNIYVEAKKGGGHDHFNLIPSCYYKILSSRHGPGDYQFDEGYWKDSIEPRLTPEINNALFPFQKKAIFKMVKTKRCMNAASPGLGKSIQGLCCIAFFRNNTKGDVIVCPSYLRSNWYNEVKTWLPHELPNTIIIDKAGKNDIDKALNTLLYHTGIKIISYDMMANLFSKFKSSSTLRNIFNTVLCDESHFVKDSSTKRYRNLANPIKKAGQVFLLTGTPSPNRNKELFTQFSLLRPNEFYDYRVFANRYCDGHLDKFKHYDDRGASNVSELAYLMTKMVIRMRREDYIDDLPDVFRAKVVVTPKSVSKLFMKRKKKFVEELAKIETDENAKFKVQALASEMFRDTAVIKIPPVLEYLSNYCNSIDLEKTIFFCKHQSMVKAVEEFFDNNGFKDRYISISGQTDMKDRPEMIKRFRDSESDCIFAILTTGSCATGLNITPIRRMVFLELDWSPSTLDQCECRIRRIGGAKHLQYFYIICDYSLDEMVFNKIKRKTELTTNVVDGGKTYGDFEFDETQNKRRKLN